MTESEQIVVEFEERGLKDQSFSMLANYLISSFEVFLYRSCSHLTEKTSKFQIKKVQNTSAILFFLLIQIPLSRLSSAFCFVTAFIAWMLDYKTKQEIYNCLQYVLWKLANPR